MLEAAKTGPVTLEVASWAEAACELCFRLFSVNTVLNLPTPHSQAGVHTYAVDMSTATTTAACTRARAARAHHTLKLGPRIYGPRRCLYLCPGGLCFPDPTSAGGSFPPSRAGGFLRRERPVVEERRRARAACDLEGNRAGLGCLEHLGNALSFAVVTEWPVRVYPRRRRWSPPHACLE